MKKHFFKVCLWALLPMAISLAACDDSKDWSDVDGQTPTLELKSDRIESGAGHRIMIEGTVTDKDGISSINLQCLDLYLDKTINLVDIYGAPQEKYDLSYIYDLTADEIGESFIIKVIVTDVGGRSTSKDVLVTMDGDFYAPVFLVNPDENVTVLSKAETRFTLRFSVTDDKALDYVIVHIPGIENFENRIIQANGEKSIQFEEKLALPSEITSYPITLTAIDKKGNSAVVSSTIHVSEMPDFPKMYLSDVSTVEELNSDLFGVPMLIDHIGAFKYKARYYNKKEGTEIFFLPQKSDFAPICFGLDPEDNDKITDDPEASKPLVLTEANMYYEITLDVKQSTYHIRTYTVDKATDPINYKYGEPCFDRWENGGEQWIDFLIGWGNSPKDAGSHLFVQDKSNPHLFHYPSGDEAWTLSANQSLDFIISNYHPDDWWDHVEWRSDNPNEVEKFGYFSKKRDVNPDWDGTNMRWEDGTAINGDNWFRAKVTKAGNYRFEFDAHLGRGKIVPVN